MAKAVSVFVFLIIFLFDPTGRTGVARSGGRARRRCCHPVGESGRLAGRRIDPRRIHQHFADPSAAQATRVGGQDDLGRTGLPGHGHRPAQTQRTRRGVGPLTQRVPGGLCGHRLGRFVLAARWSRWKWWWSRRSQQPDRLVLALGRRLPGQCAAPAAGRDDGHGRDGQSRLRRRHPGRRSLFRLAAARLRGRGRRCSHGPTAVRRAGPSTGIGGPVKILKLMTKSLPNFSIDFVINWIYK